MIAEAQKCRLVAIIVVLNESPGVQPGNIEAPAQAVGQATSAADKTACGKASAFRLKGEMRSALALGRHDVDDAGDGVWAIERAFRAAGYLNAFHAIGREWGEIKRAAKFVQLNAVNHHQIVIGLTTADVDTCHTSVAARLAHLDAGNSAQNIQHIERSAIFDILAGDHGDGRADFRYQRVSERG